MKIKKLVIIPICLAACLTLSGCSGREVRAGIKIISKIKESIEEKFDKNNNDNNEESIEDDKSNLEEIISLSDREKKILSNLFECNIIYKYSGVNDFVSWFVYQDDVFNFDKTNKSDWSFQAIKPELAVDIAYDALGIKFSKYDFKLNSHENIDIIGAAGEETEFYINKAVKVSDEEYKVYATSVTYPVEGAYLNKCYIFNVRKNDKSMFGYTINNFEERKVEEWIPEKITASSTLKNENNSYDPKNLMDNDMATAWAEGAEFIGKGEYVVFETSKKQKVSGVFIDNGYLKTTDLLNKNSSIEKVKFEFSDGTIVESKLTPVIRVDNYVGLSQYTDYIDFGKEIDTTYIKMTILDAKVGSAYEDTCVSEIKFIN